MKKKVYRLKEISIKMRNNLTLAKCKFLRRAVNCFGIIQGASDNKESPCKARDLGLIPGSRKIPWRREWLPTPVFFHGEFHGQRSLVGHSPWAQKSLTQLSNTFSNMVTEDGDLEQGGLDRCGNK